MAQPQRKKKLAKPKRKPAEVSRRTRNQQNRKDTAKRGFRELGLSATECLLYRVGRERTEIRYRIGVSRVLEEKKHVVTNWELNGMTEKEWRDNRFVGCTLCLGSDPDCDAYPGGNVGVAITPGKIRSYFVSKIAPSYVG